MVWSKHHDVTYGKCHPDVLSRYNFDIAYSVLSWSAMLKTSWTVIFTVIQWSLVSILKPKFCVQSITVICCFNIIIKDLHSHHHLDILFYHYHQRFVSTASPWSIVLALSLQSVVSYHYHLHLCSQHHHDLFCLIIITKLCVHSITILCFVISLTPTFAFTTSPWSVVSYYYQNLCS